MDTIWKPENKTATNEMRQQFLPKSPPPKSKPNCVFAKKQTKLETQKNKSLLKRCQNLFELNSILPAKKFLWQFEIPQQLSCKQLDDKQNKERPPATFKSPSHLTAAKQNLNIKRRFTQNPRDITSTATEGGHFTLLKRKEILNSLKVPAVWKKSKKINSFHL